MRAVLLFLPLLLTSCALLTPDSGLLDRTWQVVELQGEPFQSPTGQAFTLRLQHDGRMQAYAGCNALTGIYQLKAGRGGQGMLRVGPFDLLEGLCAPDVARLERKVIHTMEGASSYQLEADGSLALRNPIQITLIRFRARP
ncbi:MAG: META domain-containing protein [Pedobacter sp.]|nr:META domain-containing protein [Pedobacter sp.]